ncbi:HTH domain-containing protein [Pedobacter chinensis]|uniref:HTH domain-containing protein n=1 Tax=Pedobacter chinensis TaxID=2282421 RepID=A0A369Q575_9SPHI|nr:sigma-70 family RNA polymerase sigma factor [Pedobacter chinensis]RDC58236.1 HTH domain-containing protein [Pedobacter chinensis]
MSSSNEMDDDVDLLLRLKRGDRLAFEFIFKKYWTFVYDSAFRRLKDHAVAEDVTQDVFVQLWTAGQATIIINLKSYLFISVRNKVIRLFQRQSKFVPIEDMLAQLKLGASERSDANLLYKELSLAYEALILQLSAQQQIIYDLKFTQNLSADEIAQRLGLSPKTVRNQIGKINYKLRTSLFSLLFIILFLSL